MKEELRTDLCSNCSSLLGGCEDAAYRWESLQELTQPHQGEFGKLHEGCFKTVKDTFNEQHCIRCERLRKCSDYNKQVNPNEPFQGVDLDAMICDGGVHTCSFWALNPRLAKR